VSCKWAIFGKFAGKKKKNLRYNYKNEKCKANNRGKKGHKTDGKYNSEQQQQQQQQHSSK